MNSEIMRATAWRDVDLVRAGARLIWVGTVADPTF
jgi:hypothetical protein